MKRTLSRVVVITGASSGIGKACKEIFEKNKDTVICLSRTNSENFAHFYPCDVADPEQVQHAFSQIQKKFPRIDVLINNAGFGLSGAVELTSDTDISRLLDVNLLGVINCFKAALPLMVKGGKILNISSVCALFPLPFRTLYCTAKAGVHMLSLSLNMECKPLGITVLSVCPGDVKTNFTKNRVKNFQTSPRYGKRIFRATAMLDGREDKRMSAEYVAKKIHNYSKTLRPKPFIIIGTKYKFLHFAMRFLPTSLLLHFTEKFFGGHEKPRRKSSKTPSPTPVLPESSSENIHQSPIETIQKTKE